MTGTKMLSLNEARSIAVTELGRLPVSEPVVLSPEHAPVERDWCFVFVYNSRRYYENHDFRAGLLGSGPMVVDRRDGSVRYLPTYASIEVTLSELEEQLGISEPDEAGTDDYGAFVARLLAQLKSLPGWSGISFRGMNDDAEFGRFANVAVSVGLVACSRDTSVATEGFTTPGVYAVLGTEGRGVESASQYPAEKEIVFLPGTCFMVVGRTEVDGYPVVLVHQTTLNPEDRVPVDVVDMERRVIHAVRGGRAAAPADVTSPGKFSGDIN